MTQIRKHKGRPDGEMVNTGIPATCATCGEPETWTLYRRDTEDGPQRFKLCADAPVCGKANYWLAFENQRLSGQGDSSRLRSGRPDLCAAVERIAAGEDPETERLTEGRDDFGDLVENIEKNATKSQKWKRALLMCRLLWLTVKAHTGEERDAALQASAYWEGIYRVPISDAVLAEAVCYITAHKGDLNYDAIMEVRRAYYADEYGPKECVMLEAQLNFVSGMGPEPVPLSDAFDEQEPDEPDEQEPGPVDRDALLALL